MRKARQLRFSDRAWAALRLTALVLVAGAVGLACGSDRRRRAEDFPAQPASFRVEGNVFKPTSADHSGVLVFCAGTSYLAYTDEKGHYVITGVPTGVYRVLAQHNDFRQAVVGDLTLPESSEESSRTVILPDHKLVPKETPVQQVERVLCSIMGMVRLRGQSRHDGTVVRAVGTDFRTVTDSEGRYQLLRLDPGQYTLVFEKTGYKERREAVRLVTGELIFPDPVVLEPTEESQSSRILNGSLALFDAQGRLLNDYKGALVYLEGTTLVALPGSDGQFRFDNLAPGRYTVSATAPGFPSRDRAEADLTQATSVSVVLALRGYAEETSASGGLVGRVLKDDPRDPLTGTLVGLVELGMTTITDANGGYTFSDIDPGTYTLVAQVEGYIPGALQQVVIPEGETAQAIDLTLQKRRDYPRVLFTSPSNGEQNITIREVVPVTVRFSKKMSPDSLRAAFSIEPKTTVRLYTGRENPLSDYDRLYVELLGAGPPATALHFNTAYTITIETAASDEEGLHMERPYQFSFKTGRASVIGTRPSDGSQEVFLDPMGYRLSIFFNAPIDPRTVTREKLRIRPSGSTAPQLFVINSPASGWSEINVSTTWEKGVRYTVTLSSGIRTMDGSPISNLPYTLNFQTSAGRMAVVTPTPRRAGRP